MKNIKPISQFGTTICDFILGARGVISIETITSDGEQFENRIGRKTSIGDRLRIGELIFSKIQNSNFVINIEFHVGEELVNITLRGVKGVIRAENPQRIEDGLSK